MRWVLFEWDLGLGALIPFAAAVDDIWFVAVVTWV